VTDGVRVLDLGEDENRINPDWIERVSNALDAVAAAPPPRALVTTASGRFFSIGFDLDWMAANPDGGPDLVDSMHEVMARVIELPAPTIAAITGHASAGGALFALAHDRRVIADEHASWWLPEIIGKIAFTPGLTEMVSAKLAPQVAHQALGEGRRFGPEEAREERVVDAVAPAGEVLDRAQALATELASHDPATYGEIKSRLYRDVLASLRDRDANAADVSKFGAAFELMGVRSPAS